VSRGTVVECVMHTHTHKRHASDKGGVSERQAAIADSLVLSRHLLYSVCAPLLLRCQELMQYRTVGSKVKCCELTLMWPKEIKVKAMGKKRVTAEKRAAALACMKLKVSFTMEGGQGRGGSVLAAGGRTVYSSST